MASLFPLNLIYATLSVHAETSLYFECGNGEFERNCCVYFVADGPCDPKPCDVHESDPTVHIADCPEYGPIDWDARHAAWQERVKRERGETGVVDAMLDALVSKRSSKQDEPAPRAPIGFRVGA